MLNITTPMKSICALCLSASLIAFSPQSLAAHDQDEPALWRVSDDDTAVYLFGLPNMMDVDTQWRSRSFDEAIAAADEIILESDRRSPEAQAKLQQMVPQVGIYRDGTKLTEVLDDDAREQFETVLANMGIPAAALNQLKPWLAANQLETMLMQRQGLGQPNTPASVIIAEAGKTNTPVSYLEETTVLISKIAAVPESSQVLILKQSLDTISNDPDSMKRILAQWASGDVEGLAESLHGEGSWPDEAVRTVMLVERNSEWQAKLEEVLETKEGVVFVAVGTGHLVGDDNLVDRLASAGFEVKRQ